MPILIISPVTNFGQQSLPSAIIIFSKMKGGKLLRSRMKASNIPTLDQLIFLFDLDIHRTLYRIINCISKPKPRDILGGKFDVQC